MHQIQSPSKHRPGSRCDQAIIKRALRVPFQSGRKMGCITWYLNWHLPHLMLSFLVYFILYMLSHNTWHPYLLLELGDIWILPKGAIWKMKYYVQVDRHLSDSCFSKWLYPPKRPSGFTGLVALVTNAQPLDSKMERGTTNVLVYIYMCKREEQWMKGSVWISFLLWDLDAGELFFSSKQELIS